MTPRRWIALFAALPTATALLLLAGTVHAIRFVRQPGYTQSTGDPATLLQDSAFTLHDTACDILIYGDSTANVGLNPSVITAQTGLSACNIATNRPVVEDLGTLPLDTFLQHNPAPRLIVLQYGPEDFYRSKDPWQNNGPYTPLLMLARNLPFRQAFLQMLSHPAETTQFVEYVVQYEFFPRKQSAATQQQYQYALDHARQTHGHLDLRLEAQTECKAPALKLRGPLDRQWPQQLHQRYPGIPVLVRAAPVPACDPQLALFQHDLANVVDANVEALPIQDFVGGDRHTTLDGTREDTLGLIAAIRARYPQLLAPYSDKE